MRFGNSLQTATLSSAHHREFPPTRCPARFADSVVVTNTSNFSSKSSIETTQATTNIVAGGLADSAASRWLGEHDESGELDQFLLLAMAITVRSTIRLTSILTTALTRNDQVIHIDTDAYPDLQFTDFYPRRRLDDSSCWFKSPRHPQSFDDVDCFDRGDQLRRRKRRADECLDRNRGCGWRRTLRRTARWNRRSDVDLGDCGWRTGCLYRARGATGFDRISRWWRRSRFIEHNEYGGRRR